MIINIIVLIALIMGIISQFTILFMDWYQVKKETKAYNRVKYYLQLREKYPTTAEDTLKTIKRIMEVK